MHCGLFFAFKRNEFHTAENIAHGEWLGARSVKLDVLRIGPLTDIQYQLIGPFPWI